MTNIVKNKNGIEFDIDAIATDLNGKMDVDGVNATCPTLLSRTPNNQGGVVEIWSDGYYVETGVKSPNVKTFSLSREILTVTCLDCSTRNNYSITLNIRLSGTTLTVLAYNTAGSEYNAWDGYWRAEGYIR